MGVRNSDEADLTVAWAENAPTNRESPTFAFGEGYPIQYDIASSPNELPVNRKFSNYVWYLSTAIGKSVNTCGGALPWLSNIAYQEGAIVTSGDPNSVLYKSTQATTNQQPSLNPAVWQPIQVANNQPQLYLDTSGGNDYAIVNFNVSFAVTDYFNGLVVEFLPNSTNTGQVTLDVNGLGAIPVLDIRGNQLISGEVSSSGVCRFVYFNGFFIYLRRSSEPYIAAKISTLGVIQGIPIGMTQANINAPLALNPPFPQAAYLDISFTNPLSNANYRVMLSFVDVPGASNTVMIADDSNAGEIIKTQDNPNGIPLVGQSANGFWIIPCAALYNTTNINNREDWMPRGGIYVYVYDNQSTNIILSQVLERIVKKGEKTPLDLLIKTIREEHIDNV